MCDGCFYGVFYKRAVVGCQRLDRDNLPSEPCTVYSRATAEWGLMLWCRHARLSGMTPLQTFGHPCYESGEVEFSVGKSFLVCPVSIIWEQKQGYFCL